MTAKECLDHLDRALRSVAKRLNRWFLTLAVICLVMALAWALKTHFALKEVSGTRWEVSDLESEVSDLEFKISDLEFKVSDLESEVSDLESEVSDLESEVSDLEFKVSDLER